MVLVRRNPDTKWWHWLCCTCKRSSVWAPGFNDCAIKYADRHARHYCPGQG